MRKYAVIFLGAALLTAQARPAWTAESAPLTPPPAAKPVTDEPRMLGLTAGHWVAIGLGALTGWAVVHHALRIPSAIAVIGGGLAGSWYWQSRTAPPSGQTVPPGQTNANAHDARWTEAAVAGAAARR